MTELILSLTIPWTVTLILGLWTLLFDGPNEKSVIWVMRVGVIGTLLSVLSLIFLKGQGHYSFAPYFKLGDYEFPLEFIVDKVNIVFSLLGCLLIGVISKFSAPYLHFEKGFTRFYFLLSLSFSALQIILFAESMDILFFGWEIMGITSVLLVSFFRNNWRTGIHSEYVIIHYRLADVGLLTAICWMHFFFQTSNFTKFCSMEANSGMFVVLVFILWGSLAKSAQIPFNTWITKAMEGPTSSSAIFYGGLSIHLGVFLLLRFLPVINQFRSIKIAIFLIGAMTAFYSAGRKRTRNDAKSYLAYATSAQVGIMYMEIALGFENLVLVHVCSNALLRTFQFLKAPGLIQDFLENPIQRKLLIIRNQTSLLNFMPRPIAIKLYTWFYAGFGFEEALKRFCRLPLKLVQKFVMMEEILLKKIDGVEDAELFANSTVLNINQAQNDNSEVNKQRIAK